MILLTFFALAPRPWLVCLLYTLALLVMRSKSPNVGSEQAGPDPISVRCCNIISAPSFFILPLLLLLLYTSISTSLHFLDSITSVLPFDQVHSFGLGLYNRFFSSLFVLFLCQAFVTCSLQHAYFSFHCSNTGGCGLGMAQILWHSECHQWKWRNISHRHWITPRARTSIDPSPQFRRSRSFR